MPDDTPAKPVPPPPTVFLSYATEDRPAARTIREALQELGLEVWYDESALDGGDAWDQKIRRQIRACDFFMPVISAQSAARPEGYFRREWRLAVERTLDMADDHLFLIPVLIDDTTEAGARVPEKFLAVQWTRLPGGQSNAALEGLARRLLSGQGPAPARAPRPTAARAEAPQPEAGAARTTRELAEFPRQEPGQKVRFWFQVLGWMLHSAWLFFQRFPRWIRILVYLWIAVLILSSRSCIPSSEHHSAKLSHADADKLKAIAQQWQGGSSDKADVGKLGEQIAQAFSTEVGAQSHAAQQPMLAVPFTTAPGDAAARKLADSAFAEIYGRVAISQHGHVGLSEAALADAAAAVQSGREHHASFVLYGAVDNRSPAQRLTVSLLKVEDGSVLWSQSYAVAGADPAAIARQVEAQVPDLEDD